LGIPQLLAQNNANAGSDGNESDESDSTDPSDDGQHIAGAPQRRGRVFQPTVLRPGRDSSPEGYTERDSSVEATDRDFSPDRNASIDSDSHIPSPSSSPPPLHAILSGGTESEDDGMDAGLESEDEATNAGIESEDDAMDAGTESENDAMDLDRRDSPTVSDFENRSVSPSDSDFLTDALTDIGSTVSVPRAPVTTTYSSRNRARLCLAHEQAELDIAYAKRMDDILAITDAITPPTIRQSSRLRTGRTGDSTEGDVWTVADLIQLEIQVHGFAIEYVLYSILLSRY
jgi:hypothetical protein